MTTTIKWNELNSFPKITYTYESYGFITVDVLLEDESTATAEFSVWKGSNYWLVVADTEDEAEGSWYCEPNGDAGNGKPKILGWKYQDISYPKS